MSTIIQQPDSLSFSGNLKKFGITSTSEVVFELKQLTPTGQKLILSEKYNPDSDGLLTIDVKAIIDRFPDISIPGNQDIVIEQPAAVGDISLMTAFIKDIYLYLIMTARNTSLVMSTTLLFMPGRPMV